MAVTSYLNFDVRIEHEAERYIARVIDSPSGQAAHAFDLPFTDLELQNFVLRIRARPRGMRRLESAEMQAAKVFGGRLFDAVFAGEVRACLRGSLDEAARQGAGLRIRLRLADAPQLVNVPWEFVYHQAVNRFLALSMDTPLVRYMDLPERSRALAVKPPLRILVMVASPHDYPPLNVNEEWDQLRAALADLEKDGLVHLELLPEATLTALQRALRQEYHILHFIGHGTFDSNTQDGLLVMADQAGRGRAISSQHLGTLLHDQHALRLVVLNACQGACSAASDPFAGIAQTLVQQGLSAVIAMQFEISDQAAITLTREFYRALADGLAVDAALSEARKALYVKGNDVEWATPVLYLRAPDGRIFDVAALSEPERRRRAQIAGLLLNARRAMATRDWTAAESAFKAVLNLDPAQSEAQTGILEAGRQRQLSALGAAAHVARQQGDWDIAIGKLEAVVQLDPGNADAIAELEDARRHAQAAALGVAARAAAARGEWAVAIAKWQAVLEIFPDHAEATTELAVARRRQAGPQSGAAKTGARTRVAAGAPMSADPTGMVPNRESGKSLPAAITMRKVRRAWPPWAIGIWTLLLAAGIVLVLQIVRGETVFSLAPLPTASLAVQAPRTGVEVLMPVTTAPAPTTGALPTRTPTSTLSPTPALTVTPTPTPTRPTARTSGSKSPASSLIPPPRLLFPTNHESIGGRAITFQWNPPVGYELKPGEGYAVFVWSRNAYQSDPVDWAMPALHDACNTASPLRHTSLQGPPLESGIYRWTVRIVNTTRSLPGQKCEFVSAQEGPWEFPYTSPPKDKEVLSPRP